MEFDKYDLIKYEIFEELFPELLYKINQEEREKIIEELEISSENKIYELFNRLCEEEKIDCPYDKNDFTIHRFEEGGIQFIEISVPEPSHQINHILRAYIMVVRERGNEEKKHMRYFVIKRFFKDESVHVMYVTPDKEVMLGDELTDHMDDKAYEHRAVARNFIVVLLNEIVDGKVDHDLDLNEE